MIMRPITTPAASALSDATSSPIGFAEPAEERRDGQGREEAVDHRRNAREDFEDRFDDGPESWRGVLGHVDRREQPNRHCDQHGDDGDQEGARENRDRTEGAGRTDLIGTQCCLGAPVQAEQKLDRRHAIEEADGFEQQRQHDPDGCQDRRLQTRGSAPSARCVLNTRTRTEAGVDRAPADR